MKFKPTFSSEHMFICTRWECNVVQWITRSDYLCLPKNINIAHENICKFILIHMQVSINWPPNFEIRMFLQKTLCSVQHFSHSRKTFHYRTFSSSSEGGTQKGSRKYVSYNNIDIVKYIQCISITGFPVNVKRNQVLHERYIVPTYSCNVFVTLHNLVVWLVEMIHTSVIGNDVSN